MPGKIWAVLAIIVVLGGLLKWAHYEIDLGGYNRAKAEMADSKDEADAKDETAVKEVIKWRDKEKVVYRDKIKKIYLTQDPTGCADTKLTDMGFGLQ